MIRCFLPAGRWDEGLIDLGEAESKHLSGVMRVKGGDCIELLDGEGRTGEGEVVESHRKRTIVRLISHARSAPIEPRRILVQALVREQKMDWLIQKAVELGVHEIWPLQAERAVVQIRAGEEAKKTARWQAIALAACKQSGNPWMPRIAPVRTLGEALGVLPKEGAACFGALQPGAVALPDFLGSLRRNGCSGVAMFIGPEGDFSPGEAEQLTGAGVQPVTFGPIVLRVETAAIFVLSSVQYEWLKEKGG